jgi:AcrR family transcriptional regulator
MTAQDDVPKVTDRPTRPRGDARRRQILDVAMRLFAAKGFNSVGIAEVAAEVGITQAGLLHHFPSKASLLLAVLQEREAGNVAERKEREAQGVAPLEAYIDTLADNDRNPELVRLFVILAGESTAAGHAGHDWFVERNEQLMDSMVHNVEAAIDPAKLPNGVTPTVVARWLLGLAHGLGAQWVMDTSAFDRAGLVRLFLEMLAPYAKDAPPHAG